MFAPETLKSMSGEGRCGPTVPARGATGITFVVVVFLCSSWSEPAISFTRQIFFAAKLARASVRRTDWLRIGVRRASRQSSQALVGWGSCHSTASCFSFFLFPLRVIFVLKIRVVWMENYIFTHAIGFILFDLFSFEWVMVIDKQRRYESHFNRLEMSL